jgi:hypothetical protein
MLLIGLFFSFGGLVKGDFLFFSLTIILIILIVIYEL